MKEHLEPIQSAEGLQSLAQKLTAERSFAFDTEFIRESSFFPQVELIQVATREEAWMIDLQAFQNGKAYDREALRPLIEAFQNPNVLKIVHAAQADQECLYHVLGVVADPVFDTAVGGSLCGYGDSVGLASLLQSVLDVSIKKGHARTNWAQRPLPKQLKEYALQDVIYLVELGERLLEILEEKERKDWALKASRKWSDPVLFQVRTDELYQKLARGGRVDAKGHGVLYRLIEWRENRVRELNVPRRWLADDSVLLDVARVRPKDLSHLLSFRGLNKGEIRKNGDQLLALIREGEEFQPPAVERIRHSKRGAAVNPRALELLKCFLAMLADQNEISARQLVSTENLTQLLLVSASSPEVWVQKNLLSEATCQLIGEELFDFIHGKRSLILQSGAVEVRKVT